MLCYPTSVDIATKVVCSQGAGIVQQVNRPAMK